MKTALSTSPRTIHAAPLTAIAPDALTSVAGGCAACDQSGTAGAAAPQAQPSSGGLGAQLGAQLPGLLSSVLGSFMGGAKK